MALEEQELSVDKSDIITVLSHTRILSHIRVWASPVRVYLYGQPIRAYWQPICIWASPYAYGMDLVNFKSIRDLACS